MIGATSKALFHSLAQVETLKRLASRYGMRQGGFARRFIAGESVEEAISAVGDLPGRGLRLTLDYLGESVASFDEADAAAQRVHAHPQRHRAVGHRAQRLAEAHPARTRRRPGDRRRQHAAHPGAGRPARLLRAHRHGEFAVHRSHAAGARDPVAAGPSQPRHGHPVVPDPIAAGRRDLERDGRARPPGEGRLQGTQDRGVPGQVARWTRRSSN